MTRALGSSICVTWTLLGSRTKARDTCAQVVGAGAPRGSSFEGPCGHSVSDERGVRTSRACESVQTPLSVCVCKVGQAYPRVHSRSV